MPEAATYKDLGQANGRKTLAWAIAAVFLTSAALASMNDKVLRFSTPGPDRYADGTTVADGECYALVWSPKGSAFSGFNADGTTISPDDRVVLAAPLAKDGKCRDALFQVPASEYAELEGGEWSVCLVDTRTARGVPVGAANNMPLRVNRWGAVKGGVEVAPAEVSLLKAGLPAQAASGMRGLTIDDTGARASVLSAVPASVRPPKITAFEMADGVARLTVEDTVPFLTYTLSSGNNPDTLAVDAAADLVDGDTAKPIAIETEATGNSRFFKVTRAE